MINKNIIDLRNAIVRFSPLIADDIGFPMTPEELRWLYESIATHYITNHKFDELYSLESLNKKLGGLLMK